MANIQIPITENGTTTLATAGKYCDRNIDVNVEVAGSGSPSLRTVTTTFVNNKANYPPIMPIYINASGGMAYLMIMPGNTVQAETAQNSILVLPSLSGSKVACSAGSVRQLDYPNNNVWGVTAVGDTYTFTD